MYQLSILKYLEEQKVTKIVLPLKDGDEIRTDCITRMLDDSMLESKFLPDSFTTNEIDDQTAAIISLDLGGPILSVRALLSEINGEDLLKLKVSETQIFDQRRNFYRVYMKMSLQCTCFLDDGTMKHVRVKKEDLNISGNGVLFPTFELLPEGAEVRLEIDLPDDNIRCRGTIKRVEKKKNGKYVCAVEYIDILPKSQMKIVRFCNTAQRKELAQKIVIKNELSC